MVLFPLGAHQAHAVGSGGFRVETVDAKAMAMGSATVAQADNPSAVMLNPAGTTQLKGGHYFSYGSTYINSQVSHTDFAGNESQMRDVNSVIPHFYFVSDLGTDPFAFGLGASSTWGTGTHWNDDSFARYIATKSELFFHDYAVTAAYALNEKLSLGAALDFTHTKANRKKKLLQLGGPDGDLQLKGKDDAFGYRASALYKINEHHQLGVQYRSEIDIKYEGEVTMHGLNAAGLNYAAIFGGPEYSTNITSRLTLPQAIVVGYLYRPNDKWSFELDVEWMDWSSVEQELSEYPNESNPVRLAVLNTGNPIPRDWEGAFSLGFGVEYNWTERFRLRGGYFFMESPIPIPNLDTSLPDANSHSLSCGFGYDLNPDVTLDVAYAGMFFENQTVDNGAGSAFGANIDGKFEEFIHVATATMTHRF